MVVSATAMRVETIDDVARLTPYLEAWDELAIAAARPYCQPAWMLAWWRHLRHERAELRVLVAREGERVLGVAPFAAEAATPGLARYRLLASGVSPRIQPLAAAGHEAAVAEAFGAALAAARPRPSVIRLDGLPDDSPWPRLLADRWPGTRTRPYLHHGQSVPSPTITLEGRTYDDWFRARSAKFRQRSRQSSRRLEAAGGRFRLSDPERLEADVAAFARLHHARWTARGGSGVLDERVERMVLDAGRALVADGRFRLWVLEAGGRTIAGNVFLAAGGEQTWWLGGFDDDWAYYQPSLQTLLRAVEDGVRRGERRFDLGSGGQRYKYSYADGEDTLVWWQLVPPGLRYPVRRAQLLVGDVRARRDRPAEVEGEQP